MPSKEQRGVNIAAIPATNERSRGEAALRRALGHAGGPRRVAKGGGLTSLKKQSPVRWRKKRRKAHKRRHGAANEYKRILGKDAYIRILSSDQPLAPKDGDGRPLLHTRSLGDACRLVRSWMKKRGYDKVFIIYSGPDGRRWSQTVRYHPKTVRKVRKKPYQFFGGGAHWVQSAWAQAALVTFNR
jgi:hypothetical protein